MIKPVKQGAIRRKDLDIHELLALCSEPLAKHDRVQLLKQYATVYPELKCFLLVAYFYKDVFKSINDIAPLTYIPSRVSKGASIENVQSMWREITRMYDTYPSGPRTRRGKAQRLLGDLFVEDAKVVFSLLTGKFYNKELNESVVAEAFPTEVPVHPKAAS